MPGYAYALAGVYTLVGGYHPQDPHPAVLLIGTIQALFHAGTATFLFLLCRRIFGGSGSPGNARGTLLGAAAAACWAAFTPAQIFSAIHMPSAWVICAFWGLLYWLIGIRQSGNASCWHPWVWIGLIVGVVATLIATVMMLLPISIAAIILTVARDQRGAQRLLRSAAGIGMLFLGFFAGCSPCWLYNYFVAKDRVLFSAHDGVNFYVGNHQGANGYTKIPSELRSSQEEMLTDSLTIPQQALGTPNPLPRSRVSQYWKDKAHLWISGDRIAWLKLLAVKVDNFWNTYQYDDLSLLRLFRVEGDIPPGLRWGYFSPFALVGLVFALWRWPRLGWVAAAVLLLMGSLLLAFVTERYRLIAAPGIILLGIGGAAWLWEKIYARQAGLAAAGMGVLAAATWWTTGPRLDPTLWSLDFYKAGISATQTAAQLPPGEAAPHLARGQAALETAYAYVPQNTEILYALGNLWSLRADVPKAEASFLAALQLNSKHEGALANLAQLYSDHGHWVKALPYMERALELAPGSYKRWYSLSLIYKGLGDSAKARDAARRALQILLPLTQAEPRNPDRWSTLAQVYHELGDSPAALQAIRRARALLPDHQGLEKLEREMAGGQK